MDDDSRPADGERPLGFKVTADTPPGEIDQVTTKAQMAFQGKRLYVSSTIARFFKIVDVKVGVNSQLAGHAEIDAMIYSEVSENDNLKLEKADLGEDITIVFRNTDAAAQRFSATMTGDVWLKRKG